MKRTINLFAEVVSSPFSGYFIEKDPFVDTMKKAGMCQQKLPSIQKIHNFINSIDEVAVRIAG